jgi:hypothetical protein
MVNVHALQELRGMDFHVLLRFKLAQEVNIGNPNGTNVCVPMELIGMDIHALL